MRVMRVHVDGDNPTAIFSARHKCHFYLLTKPKIIEFTNYFISIKVFIVLVYIFTTVL